MSKRKNRKLVAEEINIAKLVVGDSIVLEDGSIAEITCLHDKEIEVVKKTKVRYMEYQSEDRKGRHILYSSVHTDEDVLEMLARETAPWYANATKRLLGVFRS